MINMIFKIVAGLLISLAFSLGAVELYVRIYVYRSGLPRSAHSDDYGMAFDALLVAVSVFIFFAIVCYAFFRKKR